MSAEDGLHRWAAPLILNLSDEEAARWGALDVFGRIEQAAALLRGDGLPDVFAAREPVCADCRVSWADVHAEAKPWPCRGERPAALGGTLINPTSSRPAETRQQRRKGRRAAEKAHARPRDPGADVHDAVQMAIWKDQSVRRQNRERKAKEVSGLEALAEHLAGVDDLAGFLS